jgi:hypothetical protein
MSMLAAAAQVARPDSAIRRVSWQELQERRRVDSLAQAGQRVVSDDAARRELDKARAREIARDLDRSCARGLGVATAGLVVHLTGMSLANMGVLAAASGDIDLALTTSALGSACYVAGPLMNSIAATKVQSTYWGYGSPSGVIRVDPWGLYQAALGLGVASSVVGAAASSITNSSIGLIARVLSIAGSVSSDILFITSNARNVRSIRQLRSLVETRGVRVSVVPVRTRSGSPGLALTLLW